jgi:hypothetical protein
MKIFVTRSFAFAYEGIDVVRYETGQTVDVPAECGDLAIEQRWAVLADASGETVKAKKPATNKARKSAPENK